MKKVVNYLIIVAVSVLVAFTSCKNDNDADSISELAKTAADEFCDCFMLDDLKQFGDCFTKVYSKYEKYLDNEKFDEVLNFELSSHLKILFSSLSEE
jgi:hypothetical protein